MMAFPSMLVDAAEKAGMAVPENPDEEFDKEEYPHFHVFCSLQLGRPMVWGEHWENAEIIAKIPVEKLKTMVFTDFLELGLKWSN